MCRDIQPSQALATSKCIRANLQRFVKTKVRSRMRDVVIICPFPFDQLWFFLLENNLLKVSATLECTLADVRHTRGYVNGTQSLQSLESVVVDASNAIRDLKFNPIGNILV